MKLSKNIRPISYFKSHTAEIIKQLHRSQKTMIITQNGEAKAVVQDIESFEQQQESMALLKALAQSKASIEQGKAQTLEQAFADLDKQIKNREV